VPSNARAHASLIRSARARVIVFPELSLTGYELDAEPASPGDQVLMSIVEACAEANSVALVGAPVAGIDGRPHIGTLRIGPDGVDVAYRKCYLSGEEPVRFAPGGGPVAFKLMAGALAWESARTPASSSTFSPPQASTLTSTPPASFTFQASSTCKRAALSGSHARALHTWPLRASPTPPAVASTTQRASRRSGALTEPRSREPVPNPASWPARPSANRFPPQAHLTD
jgi:hypothetical protein